MAWLGAYSKNEANQALCQTAQLLADDDVYVVVDVAQGVARPFRQRFHLPQGQRSGCCGDLVPALPSRYCLEDQPLQLLVLLSLVLWSPGQPREDQAAES